MPSQSMQSSAPNGPEASAGALNPTARGRVLVVDDNDLNQRLTVTMLDRLGYSADVAGDGPLAVSLALAGSYGVVFMDCHLPTMDGYQAAAEIRRLEGRSRHTPIVALTGSGTGDDRGRCLAAGMDDYLLKPISLQALGEAAERWMSVNPTQPDPARGGAANGPRAPGDADASLDPEIVAEFWELGSTIGHDRIRQMVSQFIASAETHMDRLRRAIDHGRLEETQEVCHSMRGGLPSVGALRLGELCSTLEARASAGDSRGVGDMVRAVGEEMDRVSAALYAEFHLGLTLGGSGRDERSFDVGDGRPA
jgi:CheY-like chemotaxis protein